MHDDTTTTATSSGERDPRSGRFLPGNSGFSGRPKGSRNKLGEAFVADLLADWQQHGPAVIEEVRTTDPSAYLKVVATVLPKQIEADVSVFADARSFAEAFELAVGVIGGDPDTALRRLRRSNPKLIEATLIDE